MKRNLSPAAAALLSLSLVLGILVVDLTGAGLATTARAQSGRHASTGTPLGSNVTVANAKLGGGAIASGVIVNGAPVDEWRVDRYRINPGLKPKKFERD